MELALPTAKSLGTDTQNSELRKDLGAFDAIAIVVGTIIGSAIFLIPSTIADLVRSPVLVLPIWVAGGALTLFGALSLAELGALFPGAGGLYTYLREAYGLLPAFLYGWGLLAMIHSGSIAALALGFSVYFGQLFGLGVGVQKLTAVACILLLTVVNWLGIHTGKLVQNTLTVIKIGGMSAMILLLFMHGTGKGLLSTAVHTHSSGQSTVSAVMALIAILWAYEGWHVVSFAGGEMRSPRRDLPLSLMVGTLIIFGLYILANGSYYAVMTPDEIRSTPAVAAVAMQKSFGKGAAELISTLIAISVLGSMNAMIMMGPRAYYAMASDRMFFRAFGELDARNNSPIIGLSLQGGWASVLCCSGSYQQVFTDVIFVAWLFYATTVSGVIVLRCRKPHLERPYKVPGYPFLPLIFSVAAVGIAVTTIAKSPVRSLAGIALILAGVPLFLFFRRYEPQGPGPEAVISNGMEIPDRKGVHH
jgi:basic amino acid/polyamine antiporter, APA family